MPSKTPATPSHSLDAERTLLGALLMDGGVMLDIVALVAPEDFFDPVNKSIYSAMHRLHDARTPIDFMTVGNVLASDQQVQQLGGSAYLAEMANRVPTASHARQYAEIVREKSLRRQLNQAATEMARLAREDERSTPELLEAVEQQLMAIARQSADTSFIQLSDLRDARYEHYVSLYESDDPSTLFGLTTGFSDLDRLLTGIPPGDLVVIAGRPSMGKTALALDLARHAAGALQKTVTLFSLEMSKEQLADRMFAGAMGVSPHHLKRGQLTEQQFRQMGSAFDGLSNHHIYLDDTAMTLAEIRSRARRHQHEHGMDLLVVDYLQLIEVRDRAAGENQTQRIGFISRSLKQLARELGCPVIALSQLSRACETPHPRAPVLSDLRDSGSIEQDADTVLMLYREGYYNEDCEAPDVTDLYIRKQRQGPTGSVELRFDAQRMKFISVDRHHATST